MSYRRRYRRRYRRPATPPPQDDGCLKSIVITCIVWGLCILAVGISIALHR